MAWTPPTSKVKRAGAFVKEWTPTEGSIRQDAPETLREVLSLQRLAQQLAYPDCVRT